MVGPHSFGCGCIGRRSVDTRDFATHWTNVGAQLAAMMNGVKKREPEKAADGVLEEDFLLAADDPGCVIPEVVVESVQFHRKRIVMMLVSSNHFLECGRTLRGMPAD